MSGELAAEHAVVADQAAAQAAAGHGQHGPFHSHCENCGTPLAGPWCHRCGQHDFEFHRSFRHVFWEALESFFHFEGKFFQNIVVLLFRPGRLTADFNAGKRAAQMPPFRLYVFVSLLFFFLLFIANRPGMTPIRFGPGTGLSLTKDGETVLSAGPEPAPAIPAAPAAPTPMQQVIQEVTRDLEREQDPQRAVDRLRQAAEQVAANAAAAREEREKQGPSGPGIRLADPQQFGAPPGWTYADVLGERARRAMTPEGQRQMVSSFFTALPKMLLFCLPFFALYTRFLFRGAGQVYLQHLVLALHFHTFIYLFVLFRDGWGFLAGLTGLGLRRWLMLAANVWLLVYPFLMLRQLFRRSWIATIFKTFVLLIAYAFTLLAGFLATAIILFLLL